MLAFCNNCHYRGEDYTPLSEVADLSERIAPGEPVPAGECPECGALVTAVTNAEKVDSVFKRRPDDVDGVTWLYLKRRATDASRDTDGNPYGAAIEACREVKETAEVAIKRLRARGRASVL